MDNVLTSENMAAVARAAQLGLADAERESMRIHLNRFLHILEAVCAADTAQVAPLVHPLALIEDMALHLADDVVQDDIDRAANQQSAPAVADGLYLVPRVID